MTHREISGGMIAVVIVFGAIALAMVTNGWFLVALLIAAFVATIFLIGSSLAR
jgi:hypothetical protein